MTEKLKYITVWLAVASYSRRQTYFEKYRWGGVVRWWSLNERMMEESCISQLGSTLPLFRAIAYDSRHAHMQGFSQLFHSSVGESHEIFCFNLTYFFLYIFSNLCRTLSKNIASSVSLKPFRGIFSVICQQYYFTRLLTPPPSQRNPTLPKPIPS